MLEKTIAKADVLCEAMPYIQRFRGAVVVVKFGGSAMEDPALVASTMRDVVMMECIGMKPVVVHGGGKAISAELKKRNIPVRFVNGLRYTDDAAIQVVDDVLHNNVNAELVRLGCDSGARTVGISGKKLITARRITSADPATGEALDLGNVGDVEKVNPVPVLEAINSGFIPVVTPLGTGTDGRVYNINADTAACRIAEAVHARKLVFLSDVPGVLRNPDDPDSVIPSICTGDIPGLIADGTLSGGMLPKLASCVHALDSGINKVHMIDGRIRHSLLLELFTDHGIGTQIVRPDSVM